MTEESDLTKTEIKALKDLPRAKKKFGWILALELLTIPLTIVIVLIIWGYISSETFDSNVLIAIAGVIGLVTLGFIILYFVLLIQAWMAFSNLKDKTKELKSEDFDGLHQLTKHCKLSLIFIVVGIVLAVVYIGYVVSLINFIARIIFYIQLKKYYSKRDFYSLK